MRVFLLIGGLNYLAQAVGGTDALGYLRQDIRLIFYVVIGLSGLYLAFQRDYYLPFLGECAFPLSKGTKDTLTKKFTLTGMPPNANVVYWGASSSMQSMADYKQAYGDYSNSGIAKTDAQGNAIIDLACPAQYSVKMLGVYDKLLAKHVHYRYELPDASGMFSPVLTKSLQDDCP